MAGKANGYLYRRGGTWWGRVRLAGREYRRSLRTPDAKEARLRLKAWRLKLERGAVADPDSPTWKEAVVRWAGEVLSKSVKPAVAKRYLVSIKQLETVFGDLRINQITAQRISEYISQRTKTTTNATIRRDLTALSRLLSACVSWGWRHDNPARAYDRSIIRETRDPISPPRDAEIATVIAAAPEGMAHILRLLNETGMRENEAVSLERTDVSWETHQIRLIRTKTNRPRTIEWKTPGGNAGPVLQKGAGKGVLFTADTGKPYSNFSSNFVRVMRDLGTREKKAGREFRRFRVHDLRHAFALRWLRAGGNIYELSLHLGHTSVKTTEVYLGHLTARERAIAQFGARGHTQTGEQIEPGATESREIIA
jgi:integrase/recombinase XerD